MLGFTSMAHDSTHTHALGHRDYRVPTRRSGAGVFFLFFIFTYLVLIIGAGLCIVCLRSFLIGAAGGDWRLYVHP